MTTPIHLRTLDALPADEKTKTVHTVLADDHRKLVSITLREGAILASHKAIWPITIHCVDGEGELVVGEETIKLSRGVIVPLDAHVMHEVSGKPEMSLLVTMFRSKTAVG